MSVTPLPRRFTLWLLVAAVLAFVPAVPLSAAPAAVPAAGNEAPVILIFGDSLSTGYGFDRDAAWPSLLEERLEEAALPHRVVNASRSGETTTGATRRFPDALDQHRPEVAVIQLGGNDGLRGLPVTAMRDNLATLVERAQEAGAAVLLVGIRLPPNYGPAYLEQFEAVYPEIASDYDTALVPFLLDGVWDRPGMLQEDRIHPTAEAQPLMLEIVWEALAPLLEPAS